VYGIILVLQAVKVVQEVLLLVLVAVQHWHITQRIIINRYLMRQKDFFIFPFFLVLFIGSATAQITPPGYEREVEQMKEQKKASIMDRQSVIAIDTAIIIDPDDFSETIKITRDTITLRQYCEGRLGVQNADRLLDGKPRTITNPITYEDMIIQWNRSAGRLDTLRRKE
jgi:hypothetical protein